ncbi:hypothetical protein B5G28_02070 [Faecalibacterium sp. An77]|nr:hypothetical protein B5G28_02070 [Faecalibacterium sp. An77]
MTAVVLTKPCQRRGFSRFIRFPGCAPASPRFCQALQMKPPQKDQIKTQIPVPVKRSGDLIFYGAFLESENQVMRWFASYRSAVPNVTNEPERNGPAELPETRKLYGTQ